jgi:MFS family permease
MSVHPSGLPGSGRAARAARAARSVHAARAAWSARAARSARLARTPRPPRPEQRHRLLATGLFLVLGIHVGVYAVALARLATSLHLRPGTLGSLVGAAAAAGIVTLCAGGRLADRFGRRPVLLTGFLGTALAFTVLAAARSVPGLVVGFVLYGLTSSFIDLGANTVGADFERAYDRRVMTSLHAGFSLGALLGALSTTLLLAAGGGYRTAYLLLALVLATAALPAATASFPPSPSPSPTPSPSPSPARRGGRPGPTTDRRATWRIPGVGLAIGVIAVAFFGDGALESFLGVYLTEQAGPDGLFAGLGISAYHLASLLGRLGSARLQQRHGERRSLLAAGLLASAGITAVVTTPYAPVVIAGLLTVGFAVAPIVPIALSLAARSAPDRSGQAVAVTTATGYSAFIVGPVLVGHLADVTGLRTALALLTVSTLAVSALATRWPKGG